MVGLVPFAAAVNIGPQYATADWIDKTAIAPYHADSMDGTTNNVNALSLWPGMNNTSWGGCVEMRPMPYDVSDDAPTSANPSTLFVPMFAPDEPDNWTCSTSNCSYSGSSSSTRRYNGAPSGNRSYNNYLPDFPSSQCGSSSNSNWTCQSGNGNCGGSGVGKSEEDAYARTCKYGTAGNKVTPVSITVGGIPGGPNFMCTTTALTSLTTDEDAVKNSIADMIALGATNIQAGLMWGWRVLSPTTPFTEGSDYTVNDNQKILIFMTDGENTYYPNSKMLKSWYGAWGFIAKNHLGTTSTDQDLEQTKMDERTAIACQNVKDAGITVYTVAFTGSGGINEATQAMLVACATDPSMAYVAADQSALLAAFSAIGDEITLLRISQ
jgi:hypothetical protein